MNHGPEEREGMMEYSTILYITRNQFRSALKKENFTDKEIDRIFDRVDWPVNAMAEKVPLQQLIRYLGNYALD